MQNVGIKIYTPIEFATDDNAFKLINLINCSLRYTYTHAVCKEHIVQKL